MENTETSKTLMLRKCLQKAFKNAFTLLDPLESTLKQTLPKVESLANLMDQYECCSAVISEVEPVSAIFPDLVPRLLVKISEEISQIIQELRETLVVLKETQEKFSKYHDVAVGLYHKHLAFLDFHTMMSASPTAPSMADMIEWLEDADVQLYELYYCKLHLLEKINVENDINSDSFVQKWTNGDQAVVRNLKEHFFFVKLFVEEKL